MNRTSPPEDLERITRPVIMDLLQAPVTDRAPTDQAGVAIDTSPPIPMVHLGLHDLRGGAGIDHARHVAWRQLVRQGGDPVALAEVVVDPSGVPQVTQLNFGPWVESIANLLARPGRSVDSFNGEVRILQIPALYTMALWYEGPNENVVVPVDPAPEPLVAGREYPLDEFLEVMRGMARDANPEGPALPSADGNGGSGG